jgi:uncharacterized protein
LVAVQVPPVTSESQPPARTAWLMERLVAARWLLLLVGLALAAVCWVPAQQLSFNRSLENMFAPGDPLLPPFAKLKRTLGNHEIVLAAYVEPQLMSPAGFERVEQLATKLEACYGVASVLSLNRTPLGAGLLGDSPQSRALLELFEGLLIGSDRQTTSVVCLLRREVADQSIAIDEIRRITQQHDATGVIVGEPVMVVDGFRYLEQDGRRLQYVSTALVVLTILLCFRSIRWVIVPLAVVQLALLLTIATLVAAKLQLTMVSSMLTANVTIIGIATTIHFVIHFRELRERSVEPQRALVLAGAALAGPIASACLTDCFGFGSLLAASVGPVHDFGLMMLVASLYVLLSLVLLVPGLALIGASDRDPRRAWGEGAIEVGLSRLTHWVERRPRTLAIISAVIGISATLGCLRLEVETDFTRNFRQGSPLVRAYEFVEERLGGAGVWDAMIPAPEELTADYLQRIGQVETKLRDLVIDIEGSSESVRLTKVLSIADVVQAGTLGIEKLLPGPLQNRALQQAIAQVRSEMPDFYAALIGIDPTDGRRYARIMLRARERMSAAEKQALIAGTTRICREEFPKAEVTGYFVLLANLINSTARDQWVTFGLSSLGIGGMMLAAFRSFKLALVAIVPNALPIFVVTGLLGWLGVKINMGGAMIAAVSLGLSVDSSVHYITAYGRLRRHGYSLHEAVASAHLSIGRAMVFSTVALVVGFSALCLSQFVPTIYFGALVGLTMIGGLAGNLVVLPLLLALVDRKTCEAE